VNGNPHGRRAASLLQRRVALSKPQYKRNPV
jgi:hypothetical protein